MADGSNVDWYFNDNSGRQSWALQVAVKNKAKEIKSIVGQWKLFASGSGKIVGELTDSIVDSEGEVMSKESSDEWFVKGSIEVIKEKPRKLGSDDNTSKSVKIEGGKGGSSAESSSVSSQLTNSSESKCIVTCDAVEGKRAYLFQWHRTVNGVGKYETFTSSTCDFVCTYELDVEPTCFPRYCANSECTQCQVD